MSVFVHNALWTDVGGFSVVCTDLHLHAPCVRLSSMNQAPTQGKHQKAFNKAETGTQEVKQQRQKYKMGRRWKVGQTYGQTNQRL